MSKYKSITIKLRPVWKREKGHPEKLSGAGVHSDRRTKRKRTRSDRNRAALKDQE